MNAVDLTISGLAQEIVTAAHVREHSYDRINGAYDLSEFDAARVACTPATEHLVGCALYNMWNDVLEWADLIISTHYDDFQPT